MPFSIIFYNFYLKHFFNIIEKLIDINKISDDKDR